MRYVKDSLKIFFIICILLFGIFTSFSLIYPKSNIVSAADPMIQYDSFIALELVNSSEIDNPIHPLTGVRNVKIKVKYFDTIPKEIKENNLIKGLLFGFFKFTFLVRVNLTIEDSPTWCNSSVTPQYILFEVFDNDTNLERNVTLQVAVDKKSTALFPFVLKVEASIDVSPDDNIKLPPTVSLPVSFTPSYLPLISTNSGVSIKKTLPGNPVNWSINISNYGTGETLVRARIIDPPEGWIISLNPQIVISSVSDANSNWKILTLTALPPSNFGYFNNKETFEIELTPEFSLPGTRDFANLTKGESIIITFAVKLRGVSLPGFEFIFLLSIFLIFIISKKIKNSKRRVNP